MQQQQQQIFLSQITGLEQSQQEEIQLTELLPVKQSRIRENIFKDANATDALRALRSFSSDCDDGEQFDLREFNFCRFIDHLERPNSKYQQSEARRNRIGESNNNASENIDEDTTGDKVTERNASKVPSVKRNIRAQVPRKNLMRSNKRMHSKKVHSHEIHEKLIRMNATDDDEFEYGEETFKKVLYASLDNKDCFKDEIYMYRREPLDPCLNSEESEATSREGDQQDIREKDHSYMDGNLFNGTVLESNLSENIFIKNEEEEDYRCSVDEKDDSEKELRLKIDSIIQANHLARENNNIVDSNELKLTSISSTSSTIISTNAKNNDNFLCNSKMKITREKELDQIRQVKNQQSIPKRYSCLVCEARFKGNGGLRNHYKVAHGAGPLFKCDECGKEFPLKERLKLHIRVHTGFKPYKCSECDKSFARGNQLVQHRRTHSNVRPYRCGLCSYSFTCSANLVLHVKRHKGQKDHKCDLCGHAFVRRDALKKHLECLHRDVKSFLCEICNKTFKGHLPQHMRTHARDRPHGCATCGQRFAQKSQLTVHQRTHTGQRPFRCLVCWQAFAHSTALKLHTRRHTGERPFKCTECNAGFTQLPHWKKHMRCVHGRSDPYGCKYCTSFFRIKSDLESHEKACHPEMEMEDDGSIADRLNGSEIVEKNSVTARYKLMTVARMRLLLAVLLKRISKQERLDELGFGKRLIDDVLQDSLLSAGKQPVTDGNLSELETLTRNLEIFLEWTVPKEHWENFRRKKKSPEDILVALTST